MVVNSVADVGGWQRLIVRELSRLTGQQHDRKKKNTIIALIDGRLAGLPEESIWRRDDVCARSTWHERWKSDPLISSVLSACMAIADDWADNRVAMALAETAERLALESPASLNTVIHVRDNADNYRDRLSAAFGIMDRASATIAPKSSATVAHTLNADTFAEMQRRARVVADELEQAALANWQPASSADNTD